MKKIKSDAIDMILESYGAKIEPKKVKTESKFGFNDYFLDTYEYTIKASKLHQEDVGSDNYVAKKIVEAIREEEHLDALCEILNITEKVNEVLGESEVDLYTRKSLVWDIIKNEGFLPKLAKAGLKLGQPLAKHPIKSPLMAKIQQKAATIGSSVKRGAIVAGKTAAATAAIGTAGITGIAAKGFYDGASEDPNKPKPESPAPAPTPASPAPESKQLDPKDYPAVNQEKLKQYKNRKASQPNEKPYVDPRYTRDDPDGYRAKDSFTK